MHLSEQGRIFRVGSFGFGKYHMIRNSRMSTKGKAKPLAERRMGGSHSEEDLPGEP